MAPATSAISDRAYVAWVQVRDLRRRADLPAAVCDAARQAYALLAEEHHGAHGEGCATSMIDVDALPPEVAMARIAIAEAAIAAANAVAAPTPEPVPCRDLDAIEAAEDARCTATAEADDLDATDREIMAVEG